MWRLDALKSVRESCCCQDYLILRRGRWVGEIFALEKGCLGDACGACVGGSKFPTLVVFGGRAHDKSVCAVLGVGAAFV